jgi:hypothetical protein
MNVVLPKGKDYVARDYGDDQYIEVIVYYGYGWLVHDADQGRRYIVSSPNPDSISSHRLMMKVNGGSSYTLWEDSEFINTPSVTYREKDDKIGYTKAAIVKIPTSVFSGSTDTPVYFEFQNQKGDYFPQTALFFTHDTDSNQVIAETYHTAREDHIEHSFPRVILTFIKELTSPAGFFKILTCAVIIATPIVAILTAIKGRKRHYPYLIIISYVLLTLICILGLGDSLAGLTLFLLLVYYVIPGATIIAILQLIVSIIVKTARAHKANKHLKTADATHKK